MKNVNGRDRYTVKICQDFINTFCERPILHLMQQTIKAGSDWIKPKFEKRWTEYLTRGEGFKHKARIFSFEFFPALCSARPLNPWDEYYVHLFLHLVGYSQTLDH